ncbi:MAG: hypothetical protein JNM43_09150 [Planctomycetaceae bacterium]|nr:hypothetical protein [Planctomycetaceae bacterium]
MIAELDTPSESPGACRLDAEELLAKRRAPASNERRLLLIDDQPSIHDAFRSILQPISNAAPDLAAMELALFGEPAALSSCGPDDSAPIYIIESAYQGEDGLRCLSRSLIENDIFHAAVVDMCMPPGWDGVETIRQLWNLCPGLKVIVCTAHSAYSWPDVVALLGRSDQLHLLPKPFSKADAMALIEAVTAC